MQSISYLILLKQSLYLCGVQQQQFFITLNPYIIISPSVQNR